MLVKQSIQRQFYTQKMGAEPEAISSGALPATPASGTKRKLANVAATEVGGGSPDSLPQTPSKKAKAKATEVATSEKRLRRYNIHVAALRLLQPDIKLEMLTARIGFVRNPRKPSLKSIIAPQPSASTSCPESAAAQSSAQRRRLS